MDGQNASVVYVPLSAGTVANIRKAIQYLWKHQSASTTACPNPAPNPRSDIALNEAIGNYGVALVYGKITTGSTTRTATCSVRNPYTEKLFLRMLSYTWRMLPAPQGPGNVSTRTRSDSSLCESVSVCLLVTTCCYVMKISATLILPILSTYKPGTRLQDQHWHLALYFVSLVVKQTTRV